MIDHEWTMANVDDVCVDWGYLSAGDNLIADGESRIDADRADCCLARPLYSVLLPANERRRSTAKLVLCRHHLRSAYASLLEVCARIYDDSGQLITSGS